MPSSRFNRLVGIVIGASLMASSTGAVAATSTASVRQINPWAALAVMSGAAPAAALCGVALAAIAAQAPGPGCVLPVVDAPVAQVAPPPPVPIPPVEVAAGRGINPLFLALGALLAGVGLYFLLRKHTNSPA